MREIKNGGTSEDRRTHEGSLLGRGEEAGVKAEEKVGREERGKEGKQGGRKEASKVELATGGRRRHDIFDDI